MTVVGRQKPDVVNADVTFVSVVQDDLHHVGSASSSRLEVVDGSREEAVKGLAPDDAHSSAHHQLPLAVGLQVQDLQE